MSCPRCQVATTMDPSPRRDIKSWWMITCQSLNISIMTHWNSQRIRTQNDLDNNLEGLWSDMWNTLQRGYDRRWNQCDASITAMNLGRNRQLTIKFTNTGPKITSFKSSVDAFQDTTCFTNRTWRDPDMWFTGRWALGNWNRLYSPGILPFQGYVFLLQRTSRFYRRNCFRSD